MISSSNITSIRVVPMSPDDDSFKGKSVWEVQFEYFLNYLPTARYLFKNGLKETKDTLVLFQFQAGIIAYATLVDKERFIKPDQNGYKGAYYFDPASICILLEPLEYEDLKPIWSNFKGFSQAKHKLDCGKLGQLNDLILSKKRIYSTEAYDTSELEDSYQQAIDNATWDVSGMVKDEPKLPLEVTAGNMKKSWGRSILIAKNALKHAKYMCEMNPEHQHFISRATGKNYVEAHHLIPMKYQSKFTFSLDVEANIVSLCVVCHNKIHRATGAEREKLVSSLYSSRSERLKSCKISTTLPELLSCYE